MASILVVDDERDIVTLIKVILEKDGHAVTPVYGALEALAKLGLEPPQTPSCRPDLALIDLMMPEMDGLELTRRLAESPATKALPVIIMTAKDRSREMFEPFENVAAVIEKPFDPKGLREAVASAVASK